MTDPEARLIMAAGETDRPLTAVQETWLARGRMAVAARPPGIQQDELIRPLPPEMSGYRARMEKHPESQWYLSKGFTPALVDLRRTCVYQSKIYTEHSGQHVADVDVDDVTAMAEVTMPLGTPPVVAPKFDAERQTFVTDLANHNLRIIGAFGGLAEEGRAPARDLQPGLPGPGDRVVRAGRERAGPLVHPRRLPPVGRAAAARRPVGAGPGQAGHGPGRPRRTGHAAVRVVHGRKAAGAARFPG
jgi:hypothetical protein